jgi:putative ABC transport system ATP-binding protein
MSSVVFSYPKSYNSFVCDSWKLQQGERVFLYGPSGSGKSTLLSLLCGIATPNSGTITINDTQINDLSQSKRDRFRATNLGIVFQQFNLIPYLSVMQNLQLSVHLANKQSIDEKQVAPMLGMLNLESSILRKPVSDLSVGQRQRVAIMRACVNAPNLMLVDEPTSSLDTEARDGFMQMLMSLCEMNQSSLIFVSHDKALLHHFDKHVALNDICSWRSTGSKTVC